MIHQFPSKAALNQALCEQITKDLELALSRKGSASLLLSGGSSPKDLYRLLSLSKLDWSKIKIGLVDERFVTNDSEFSNEKLVRETLLSHEAENAQLFPMVLDAENETKNIELLESEYSVFQNADVVILGMGDDGHTASIFPDDPASTLALESNKNVLATKAPNHPKNRITCTASLLKSAASTYLLMTGDRKFQVFEEADVKGFPIASFKPYLKAIYFSF
jgi:6-phosphogluconolactonase